MPYSSELMEGVWGPSRLIVLDRENPYRIANGTVAEVFSMVDGDYHVHVSVDQEYLQLLRPNIFATSLPFYQILKAFVFTPMVVILAYVIVSIARPQKTYLGRLMHKRRRQ